MKYELLQMRPQGSGGMPGCLSCRGRKSDIGINGSGILARPDGKPGFFIPVFCHNLLAGRELIS